MESILGINLPDLVKAAGLLGLLVSLPILFILDGSLSRTDGFLLVAAFLAVGTVLYLQL